MIVYGKNVFTQLEENPDSILKIYVQRGLRDKRFLQRVEQLNKKITVVSRDQLNALTKGANHNGIVVEVKEIPTYDLKQILNKAKQPGLIVALDGIQDPHNLGAILRSCDCTGVDGVILCKHNSLCLTPSAIKDRT